MVITEQDLICQNSQEEDMKVCESKTESAFVTASILQKTPLQISVPSKQDDTKITMPKSLKKRLLKG